MQYLVRGVACGAAIKSSSKFPPFTISFSRQPGAINATTYSATLQHLRDERHPLHVQTQRKHEAWDAHKLHWNVKHTTFISKSKVICNWAKRRVREAFVAELRNRNFDREGKSLDFIRAGSMSKMVLRGALNIIVTEAALTASHSTIQLHCEQALNQVFEAQRDSQNQRGRRRLPVYRQEDVVSPVEKDVQPLRYLYA